MERKKGRTQQQAAAKANLASRKTVAKYEKSGRLPSEMHEVRTYRTHEDAFAEDWPTVEEMLEEAPSLEAKALFEWLCEEHPGRYRENQLRTFQRRVRRWRGLNSEQVLILEQVREPGELMQTDGMWMKGVGITIRGDPLEHLLMHNVLVYSNWEWGTVAQSESLLAVSRSFQSAVLELGHLPKAHQTDNTTAATHDLKAMSKEGDRAESGRHYNADYRALLEHYGVEPRTTHLSSPDENGDVEAANGALRRAIEQHLLLRGSRDFESLEGYELWLQQIMRKRNAHRGKRLAEEVAVMRPLDVTPLPAVKEYRPRVSRGGTIHVLGNTYSVPSGLKGREIVVRVHEWRIEVYFDGKLVQQNPRLKGKKQSHVNYRHVIGTLLRKPGGFRHYRYREQMFPSPVFRAAWEKLDARLSPRRADIEYLRILKLTADNLESDVSLALELVMASGQPWDHETVAALVAPRFSAPPDVEEPVVQLEQYDKLCSRGVLCEPA